MNLTVFYPAFIKALGWTLLHSLWQGMVVFLVLWVVLKIIKEQSPQVRYSLALSTLVIWVIWMTSTFLNYLPQSLDQPVITTEILPEGPKLIAPQEPVIATGELTASTTKNWEHGVRAFEQQFAVFAERAAPFLVKIWMIGVLLFGLRMLASIYYTYRLKHIQTQPLPQIWQAELQHLAGQLGITQTVKLLESAKVDVPLIIGHLRPVILLPVGALTGLTPEQVQAVLAHELAHIRRYDFLINMILSGLEVLLFYHPAFWWIANVIRRERENCCDDIAVAACGNPRFYARTLLIMEEKRQQQSLAMAFQGDKHQLLNRIKRICLSPQHTNRSDFSRLGLMLGLCLTIGVWAWASLPNEMEEISEVLPHEMDSKMDNDPSLMKLPSLLEELPSLIQNVPSTVTSTTASKLSTTLLSLPDETQNHQLPADTVKAPTLSLVIEGGPWRSKTPVDTVPYPKLPPVEIPELAAFPEFPYAFEQLQAEHKKGKSYLELINPYKEKVDSWREQYSRNFLQHWSARQDKIHETYQQWVNDVKSSNGGDDLSAAIEINRSRIFEKSLREQEREMSKSEKEVNRNVENRIRDIERALKSIERDVADDHDAKMAVHDDRMAMHDLRMSVHDIRMDMHDARMKVHDTRMAMHDERMAAHDIIMAAFKKELYAELISDGFIKDKSDEFELLVKDGQVEINGKRLEGSQSEKYLDMLERYGFRIEGGGDGHWGIMVGKRGTSIGTFSKKRKEE